MDPNTERILSIRKGMEERGIDALILRLSDNVLFAGGYWPMFGFAFFVFPREGEQKLIVGHCEAQEAENELWEGEILSYPYGILTAADPYEEVKKLLLRISSGATGRYKRIGYEASFESVSPPWNTAETMVPGKKTLEVYRSVFPSAEFVDAGPMLTGLRSRKNAYEIEKIRIANEISCFALEAFSDSVREGVSGVEAVAAVEAAAMIKGTGYKSARRVRGFAQIASGPEETAFAYRPNEITTVRRFNNGDLVLLELAVVADGYWSDRTRPRSVGRPSDLQLRAYEAVRMGQSAAVETAVHKTSVSEVDRAGRTEIESRGFGEEFLHITGHGVGFAYHEPIPAIAPELDFELEEGMMFSVEPGVYSPEFGGIRIEDNVVITRSGPEVLGPYETSLYE
jgi:Xaa-Pro dipeptidase